MKKLLTFAIGLFASISSANAQFPCDFTFTADTTSGVYTFTAPPQFSSFLYSFEWVFFIDNSVQYGQTTSHIYSTSGIDSVMLNVYASDSTLACSSIQVFEIGGSGGSSDCQINYSGSPANPYLYFFNVNGNSPATWTLPNGNTETGFQLAYTFNGPGTYDVCASVMSGGAVCNSCVTVVIPQDTIINPEYNCDAYFWYGTSSLVGYFVPTYNVILNSSSYAWTFGDGSSSNEQYPYHEYAAPGYYDVCLTYTSGPCSDYYCQTVYIPEYSFPPIDSTCIANFIITQTSPYEVTIVNDASGNNLEFSWTLTGNGMSITSSGAYPSMQVQSAGDYLFCLDVIGADSCYASFCDSISIGDDGLLGGRLSAAGFTINIVSPQTITGFVTGIESPEAASTISLFPNPFTDFITISDLSASQSEYNVFTIEGRKVLSGTVNGANQVVSVSSLSSGVYFLQLISKEGKISTQKIVKK